MKQKKEASRLTLKELAIRVLREASEDNIVGFAAELAYYFLLALFPLLIFLTSIIGFLPGVDNSLLIGLERALPPDAMKLVREVLEDVVSHRSGGLLSFALIGTLWAASSGMVSLMEALNVAVLEAAAGRAGSDSHISGAGHRRFRTYNARSSDWRLARKHAQFERRIGICIKCGRISDRVRAPAERNPVALLLRSQR